MTKAPFSSTKPSQMSTNSAAGAFGGRPVDVVEGQHVRRHLRRLERRHADPDERHLRVGDRLGQRIGRARSYSLVQFSDRGGSRTSPTCICWRSLAPSMTTTAAGFSASISVLISCRPVVEVVAHEAGRAVGAVDDLDARVLRKGAVQAFGEAAAMKSPTTRTTRGVGLLLDDRRPPARLGTRAALLPLLLDLGSSAPWRLLWTSPPRFEALCPARQRRTGRAATTRRLTCSCARPSRWRPSRSKPAPARTAIARISADKPTPTRSPRYALPLNCATCRLRALPLPQR